MKFMIDDLPVLFPYDRSVMSLSGARQSLTAQNLSGYASVERDETHLTTYRAVFVHVGSEADTGCRGMWSG